MLDSWLVHGPGAEDKSCYYENQMNTGLTAKEESRAGTDSPAIKNPVVFSFVNG